MEASNKTTVAEILKLELMQKCGKHPELEVIFVCTELQCKDKKQFYYCMDCSEVSHEHKPKYIVKETQAIFAKWNSLKMEINEKFQKSKTAFLKYNNIINFLEQSMILPNVSFTNEVKLYSHDFSSFTKLQSEFNKIYEKEVQPKDSKIKLYELLQMNQKLEQYQDDQEKLSYLQEISEDIIFENYFQGLLVAEKNPFPDSFKHDDFQVFYRMKLRSIEMRLTQDKPVSKVVLQPQEGDVASRLIKVEHQISILASALLKISLLEEKIKNQEDAIQSQQDQIAALKRTVSKQSQTIENSQTLKKEQQSSTVWSNLPSSTFSSSQKRF